MQKPEHINDRLKAKLEYWAIKPPTPLDFEDQCFEGLSTRPSAGSSFNYAAVDTAGLWNHESYLCILLGMEFQKQECRQRFGDNLPKPTVFKAVLERLQEAQRKLPPHADWLQANVGMQKYSLAQKSAGWYC